VVGSGGIDYNPHTGRMCHRGTGTSADAREGWADDDVEAVSGCLMLVTREVFDRVGLLDERYFFGFEEIDLCLRARRAGLRTRLSGRAIAYHEGARTIGAQSSRRLYFAARNHLLLTHAHANGDERTRRGARALFVVALNLAHAVKAPGGSLVARLGATLRGIRDHLRGRYGPDRIA
jgi:GT2 family glycosyltransferase